MELKFMKAMTFAVCTTFVMTSCTNDAEENLPSGNPGTTIINARLAAYESLIQAADGENDITDVKAFLFRDGKMTKIYELGAPESENYNLQIDSRSGNLYLLAYTGGTIPTEGLEETELDETLLHRNAGFGKHRKPDKHCFCIAEARNGTFRPGRRIDRGSIGQERHCTQSGQFGLPVPARRYPVAVQRQPQGYNRGIPATYHRRQIGDALCIRTGEPEHRNQRDSRYRR